MMLKNYVWNKKIPIHKLVKHVYYKESQKINVLLLIYSYLVVL